MGHGFYFKILHKILDTVLEGYLFNFSNQKLVCSEADIV